MIKALSRLSLATRLSLLVAGVLVAAGLITSLTVYASVRRSLRDELRGRLNVQMTWLQATLEFGKNKLDFEPKAKVAGTDYWQVAARDGRVLWSSHWKERGKGALEKSKFIVMGDPKASPSSSAAFEPTIDTDLSYMYRLPDECKRVDLQITVSVPVQDAEQELEQLALRLWIAGPLALAILIAILSWLIHKLLAPLKQMARQAADIGPATPGARIGSEGGGAECVRLRDAINGMLERLARGLEREKHFSSAAAHELRTPLAQLRTQIEVTLRRPRGNDEYQATLAACLIDIQRLQTLLSNLLLLTRNLQEYVQERQTIELASVLRRAAGEAALGTALALPGIDGLKVAGTEEILTGAFRNVIENALRYAPNAPPVIKAQRAKGMVEVSVADLGPGVPEAERERIFQPLIRLDQARSIRAAGGGFGLGLAIARMAVEACGGKLTCLPRPDGQTGALFLFVLKEI